MLYEVITEREELLLSGDKVPLVEPEPPLPKREEARFAKRDQAMAAKVNRLGIKHYMAAVITSYSIHYTKLYERSSLSAPPRAVSMCSVSSTR